MGETVFFYIFSLIAIFMVVLMILQTNPVASAMCLVAAFFALAGLYILLDAPFVGIMQVLVYAGAIMVLFVFVIMLIDLSPEELNRDRVSKFKAAFLIIVTFGACYVICSYGAQYLADYVFPEVVESFGESKPVSKLLFTNYLVPFEIVSILLLVAILGVMILAKKEKA